jgi:predicted transcriptional regulator
LGKVNSRINGETIQEISIDILQEMVRVFKDRKETDPVIIDWNHQSSPFMNNGPTAPAQSMAYGEIADVYIKEDALFVKPLYTQAGLDLVKASEGVLYPSPEFLVGEVFAREGDPKPIGFAQLQAVTLTSKNKISRVLLMENIMNPDELKAMTVDQLATLVLEKDQLVKQLEAQIEGLKSENDQLSAPEDDASMADGQKVEIELEGENLDKKKMMEDEKKMSEAAALSEMASAKLMNELNAQVTSLSEQVKALTAQKHQAERKLVVDGLLNTGKIAPSEISAVESAYDIKDKFPAIWQSFSERKANQAVNLSEKGHASTAQEISFIDQVNEIKKTKGITFSEALNVMRSEQPDAYIKHFKG